MSAEVVDGDLVETVVHGTSPWGFPCPMTRSAEWRATHDRFATCHCGATPPAQP